MKNKTFQVVITGPESCGKSTLAKALCLHYNQRYQDEFAREYLENLNRPYVFEDLSKIAKQQLVLQLQRKSTIPSPVIHDTDLLTIKIWSIYKYSKCDKQIIGNCKQNVPDLYLLCDTDIPWQQDPLRENKFDRNKIFQIFKQEILDTKIGFLVLNGDHQSRLLKAIDAISDRMK